MSRESATEIERQALQWVWRLDNESHSPALEHALHDWLAADSRHRGAFLRAEAAWKLLDTARSGPKSGPVIDPAAAPAVSHQVQMARPNLSRRQVLMAGWLAAASVATGYLVSQMRPRLEHYATALGEVQLARLADGSSATLNTLSSLEVEMTNRSRAIRMVQGEVWFQVAKDRDRPFVVSVGDLRVRAVGTAFCISAQRAGTKVAVTEGTVETWIEGHAAQGVQAMAGTQVSVAAGSALSVDRMTAADIERSLAWREGKIELQGQTLAEAAAEFNRYNARKLLVADGYLANKRVYGVFHSNDPVAFAEAIQTGLGAKVQADGSMGILISPR